MSEEEDETRRFRRRLYDVIQEELKKLEHNKDSILTGWVLVLECVAPGNEAGAAQGIFGFCSEATGSSDSTPWVTRGYLNYALDCYEEMFMVDEDDDGD